MISIKLCILLSILATFTIHLTYGIPILKIFNSININNVVNFDNENNDNINCNDKSIYPVEKLTERPVLKEAQILEEIYARLKLKMAAMPFMMVV